MVRRKIVLTFDGLLMVPGLQVHFQLTFTTLVVLLVSVIIGSVIKIIHLSFEHVVRNFLTRFSLSLILLDSCLPIAASHKHVDILDRLGFLCGGIATVVGATHLQHFIRLVAIVDLVAVQRGLRIRDRGISKVGLVQALIFGRKARIIVL